jgi:pimeloyl-ACP methyl ester carboxylesterase
MARIVLVHGAFGGAWCWEPVIPGLEEAGHTVESFDLPGSGEDCTPTGEVTLDAYADRVCKVLADGPPAVLVGHSMGGVAITQAAARMPEQVAMLVYVAAFAPADGQSLMDLTQLPEGAGDQVQANLEVDGDPPVATLPAPAARVAIYGCVSDDVADAAVAKRGPQPVAPFVAPLQIPDDARAAFELLPRAYVTCLQDLAIPPALQKRMFAAAGCDPVIELDTDHAPMLSRTDKLVAALDGIAARARPVEDAVSA